MQIDIIDAGVQPLFEIVKTGHTPWIEHERSGAEAEVFNTEGKTFFIFFFFYIYPNNYFYLKFLEFEEVIANKNDSEDEFEFIA